MGIAVKSQSQREMPIGMSRGEMRVPVDHAEKAREHMKEMGMGDMMNVVPVDLYGKRTAYAKGTDLKVVEKDIREVHGLD